MDVPTGRRWTYAQLDADTDALARGLIAAGIEAGDRVGIWAPNCPEWVLLQYATAQGGRRSWSTSTRPTAPRAGLRAAPVRASGCWSARESFKTSNYRAMVEEVRAELPGAGAGRLPRHRRSGTSCSAAAPAAGEPTRWPPGGRRCPSTTRSTSSTPAGTTGFPKGATLSHHNILNNGFFIGEGCRYTEQDRVCIPVPFYHCFGMVLGNLACTTHGACIVIPGPGFDPAATLAAVAGGAVHRRCTACRPCSSPSSALPDFAAYDLSTLRTGIMAGSPCPVEVMKRVVSEMHMTEVTICYGMTETSPVSTQTRADDDMERRVSTVGRVHPHVEVKIIDPGTGLVVPRGTAGELCTRGYSVMLGYWDDEAQTAERDRRRPAGCTPAIWRSWTTAGT